MWAVEPAGGWSASSKAESVLGSLGSQLGGVAESYSVLVSGLFLEKDGYAFAARVRAPGMESCPSYLCLPFLAQGLEVPILSQCFKQKKWQQNMGINLKVPRDLGLDPSRAARSVCTAAELGLDCDGGIGPDVSSSQPRGRHRAHPNALASVGGYVIPGTGMEDGEGTGTPCHMGA